MALPKDGVKAFDDTLHLRCTKMFHNRLRDMCKARGVDKSEFVRDVLITKELESFEKKAAK